MRLPLLRQQDDRQKDRLRLKPAPQNKVLGITSRGLFVNSNVEGFVAHNNEHAIPVGKLILANRVGIGDHF